MNRLYGGHFFPRNKIGAGIADIARECFRHLCNIAVLHEVAGKVRPRPYGISESSFHLLMRYVNAAFLHFPDHFFISDIAGVLKAGELFTKISALIINIQPDDVYILSVIFCGKFNPGDHFDSSAICGGKCFRQPRNGIVICQCKRAQPFFQGIRNQPGGG